MLMLNIVPGNLDLPTSLSKATAVRAVVKSMGVRSWGLAQRKLTDI